MHYTSAYHPQSDGETERLNQCLEAYLRCFSSEKPGSWKKWLSMAEYWYNTSFHCSLEMTPFKVLYSVKPAPLNLGRLNDVIIPAAQDTLLAGVQILQAVKESLMRAQHKMKFFADQKRNETSFEKGEWVYLKLQPYRQQTIALRTSLKLSAKFFGPFQILEKVGGVAYKLKIPEHSKVHPVFHVLLLKKHIGINPITVGNSPNLMKKI